MYKQSVPFAPEPISEDAFLDTLFDIYLCFKDLPEFDWNIYTLLNSYKIANKYLKCKDVTNIPFINDCSKEHDIYSEKTEQIYSKHLAYVCIILSSKLYDDVSNPYWVTEADIYDEAIRTDYLYKMETDIFFSLGTVNFLTQEDVQCIQTFSNFIPFSSRNIPVYKYFFYSIAK